jgi:membrane protease YdiL (CAAX protease family)
MTDLVDPADAGTRLRNLAWAVAAVFGAFALGIALGLVATQALLALGFGAETDRTVFFVASTVFQFLGFYAAAYGFFEHVADFDALVHLRRPGPRDVAWAVGGLVVLIGANFVISELLVSVGLEGAQNEVIEAGRQDPVLFLFLLPVTVLFVAPAEELVFRGIVQGLFRQAWGVLPGVLLASGLFALAHFLALSAGGGSRLVTIAVIFVLGLLLAAVYELAASIVVPAAVHAAWNVTVFGWEYAAATGLV